MRTMPYFTLRVFQPMKPSRISGLSALGETRLEAKTAEDGKRQLTQWIDGRVLERERFYRFEGYAPFRGGRPHFVLNISFYLFEDGRLCPVRIWHRSEQASNQSGESDWLVDFNGMKVAVDRMSAPYVEGAVIDFVDTIEKQGFTIDNPNATGSCACGDSFH